MSRRRVESFLLRIVVSGDQSTDPARWRGKIQHIPSGAERQIEALAQMVEFISAHLHDSQALPPPALAQPSGVPQEH